MKTYIKYVGKWYEVIATTQEFYILENGIGVKPEWSTVEEIKEVE